MSGQVIKFLSACFVLSIGIVAILYALSDISTPQRESFLRSFRDNILKQKHIIDIKYNSYYIAGATVNHIYLANSTGTLHMLLYNTVRYDTQHIKISIADKRLKYRSIRTKIDSPYFYMMDGTMPYLLRGDIRNWKADRFMYDSTFFTHALPLNSSSFVIRAISGKSKQYVLGKIANDTPHVRLIHGLLEKQFDGVFCVDGMLNYNKDRGEVIYVYYYRNQYFATDSLLNLLYRAETIDSNRVAKIKTDSIRSQKALAKSGPSKIVNKATSTCGSWLFINSRALSHNENVLLFKESSIIDVYDLKTRSYQYSFYLPDYNGDKLREFQIFNDQLVALYDRYLIHYELNVPYGEVSLDRNNANF